MEYFAESGDERDNGRRKVYLETIILFYHENRGFDTLLHLLFYCSYLAFLTWLVSFKALLILLVGNIPHVTSSSSAESQASDSDSIINPSRSRTTNAASPRLPLNHSRLIFIYVLAKFSLYVMTLLVLCVKIRIIISYKYLLPYTQPK